MKKNVRPEYTKMIFGGFQTFAELTELPLGRLTFLFGPNSAGKSAVEDGFNLFSALIDTKDSLARTGVSGFGELKVTLVRFETENLWIIIISCILVNFLSRFGF